MHPLHHAAILGNLNHLLVLLESGVDPNAADEDGWTALHAAAMNGRVAAIRLLLSRGADPNAVAEGMGPLHVAIVESDLANEAQGALAVVTTLLDGGARIEAEAPNGFTALLFAGGIGEKAMIDLLVERGADVNHRAAHGWTALHEAADEDESGEGVVALLAHGADPTATTDAGETPLAVARPEAAKHLR